MNALCRQFLALVLLCLGAASPAWAVFSIPAGSSFSVPAGASVDAACEQVLVAGTLSLGAGHFSTSADLDITGTGVLNGDTGDLTVGGDFNSTGTFNPGTGTVTLTDGCVGNTSTLSGTLVFQNLVLSSTTGHVFVIPAGAHITVLGTLTLQGSAGQNIQVVSSGGGMAVINLGPSATVNRNFASVAGNVQIGAAANVQGIPTLDAYGVWLLAFMLGLIALRHLYPPRRTPQARSISIQ